MYYLLADGIQWQAFIQFFLFFSGGSRNNHEGEPRFSDSIKNISAVIGKDAILNCFVESLGMYKVGWMRHSDGSVLSVGKMVTQNTRYSVSHEETNRWTLRIHNVRDSDEGCYLCQINTCKIPSVPFCSTIKNILPLAPLLKQKGCIQLQFPPDISDDDSSSDTTIHEGKNATLRCLARSERIFRRLAQ